MRVPCWLRPHLPGAPAGAMAWLFRTSLGRLRACPVMARRALSLCLPPVGRSPDWAVLAAGLGLVMEMGRAVACRAKAPGPRKWVPVTVRMQMLGAAFPPTPVGVALGMEPMASHRLLEFPSRAEIQQVSRCPVSAPPMAVPPSPDGPPHPEAGAIWTSRWKAAPAPAALSISMACCMATRFTPNTSRRGRVRWSCSLRMPLPRIVFTVRNWSVPKPCYRTSRSS